MRVPSLGETMQSLQLLIWMPWIWIIMFFLTVTVRGADPLSRSCVAEDLALTRLNSFSTGESSQPISSTVIIKADGGFFMCLGDPTGFGRTLIRCKFISEIDNNYSTADFQEQTSVEGDIIGFQVANGQRFGYVVVVLKDAAPILFSTRKNGPNVLSFHSLGMVGSPGVGQVSLLRIPNRLVLTTTSDDQCQKSSETCDTFVPEALVFSRKQVHSCLSSERGVSEAVVSWSAGGAIYFVHALKDPLQPRQSQLHIFRVTNRTDSKHCRLESQGIIDLDGENLCEVRSLQIFRTLGVHRLLIASNDCQSSRSAAVDAGTTRSIFAISWDSDLGTFDPSSIVEFKNTQRVLQIIPVSASIFLLERPSGVSSTIYCLNIGMPKRTKNSSTKEPEYTFAKRAKKNSRIVAPEVIASIPPAPTSSAIGHYNNNQGSVYLVQVSRQAHGSSVDLDQLACSRSSGTNMMRSFGIGIPPYRSNSSTYEVTPSTTFHYLPAERPYTNSSSHDVTRPAPRVVVDWTDVFEAEEDNRRSSSNQSAPFPENLNNTGPVSDNFNLTGRIQLTSPDHANYNFTGYVPPGEMQQQSGDLVRHIPENPGLAINGSGGSPREILPFSPTGVTEGLPGRSRVVTEAFLGATKNDGDLMGSSVQPQQQLTGQQRLANLQAAMAKKEQEQASMFRWSMMTNQTYPNAGQYGYPQPGPVGYQMQPIPQYRQNQTGMPAGQFNFPYGGGLIASNSNFPPVSFPSDYPGGQMFMNRQTNDTGYRYQELPPPPPYSPFGYNDPDVPSWPLESVVRDYEEVNPPPSKVSPQQAESSAGAPASPVQQFQSPPMPPTVSSSSQQAGPANRSMGNLTMEPGIFSSIDEAEQDSEKVMPSDYDEKVDAKPTLGPTIMSSHGTPTRRTYNGSLKASSYEEMVKDKVLMESDKVPGSETQYGKATVTEGRFRQRQPYNVSLTEMDYDEGLQDVQYPTRPPNRLEITADPDEYVDGPLPNIASYEPPKMYYTKRLQFPDEEKVSDYRQQGVLLPSDYNTQLPFMGKPVLTEDGSYTEPRRLRANQSSDASDFQEDLGAPVRYPAPLMEQASYSGNRHIANQSIEASHFEPSEQIVPTESQSSGANYVEQEYNRQVNQSAGVYGSDMEMTRQVIQLPPTASNRLKANQSMDASDFEEPRSPVILSATFSGDANYAQQGNQVLTNQSSGVSGYYEQNLHPFVDGNRPMTNQSAGVSTFYEQSYQVVQPGSLTSDVAERGRRLRFNQSIEASDFEERRTQVTQAALLSGKANYIEQTNQLTSNRLPGALGVNERGEQISQSAANMQDGNYRLKANQTLGGSNVEVEPRGTPSVQTAGVHGPGIKSGTPGDEDYDELFKRLQNFTVVVGRQDYATQTSRPSFIDTDYTEENRRRLVSHHSDYLGHEEFTTPQTVPAAKSRRRPPPPVAEAGLSQGITVPDEIPQDYDEEATTMTSATIYSIRRTRTPELPGSKLFNAATIDQNDLQSWNRLRANQSFQPSEHPELVPVLRANQSLHGRRLHFTELREEEEGDLERHPENIQVATESPILPPVGKDIPPSRFNEIPVGRPISRVPIHVLGQANNSLSDAHYDEAFFMDYAEDERREMTVYPQEGQGSKFIEKIIYDDDYEELPLPKQAQSQMFSAGLLSQPQSGPLSVEAPMQNVGVNRTTNYAPNNIPPYESSIADLNVNQKATEAHKPLSPTIQRYNASISEPDYDETVPLFIPVPDSSVPGAISLPLPPNKRVNGDHDYVELGDLLRHIIPVQPLQPSVDRIRTLAAEASSRMVPPPNYWNQPNGILKRQFSTVSPNARNPRSTVSVFAIPTEAPVGKNESFGDASAVQLTKEYKLGDTMLSFAEIYGRPMVVVKKLPTGSPIGGKVMYLNQTTDAQTYLLNPFHFPPVLESYKPPVANLSDTPTTEPASPFPLLGKAIPYVSPNRSTYVSPNHYGLNRAEDQDDLISEHRDEQAAYDTVSNYTTTPLPCPTTKSINNICYDQTSTNGYPSLPQESTSRPSFTTPISILNSPEDPLAIIHGIKTEDDQEDDYEDLEIGVPVSIPLPQYPSRERNLSRSATATKNTSAPIGWQPAPPGPWMPVVVHSVQRDMDYSQIVALPPMNVTRNNITHVQEPYLGAAPGPMVRRLDGQGDAALKSYDKSHNNTHYIVAATQRSMVPGLKAQHIEYEDLVASSVASNNYSFPTNPSPADPVQPVPVRGLNKQGHHADYEDIVLPSGEIVRVNITHHGQGVPGNVSAGLQPPQEMRYNRPVQIMPQPGAYPQASSERLTTHSGHYGDYTDFTVPTNNTFRRNMTYAAPQPLSELVQPQIPVQSQMAVPPPSIRGLGSEDNDYTEIIVRAPKIRYNFTSYIKLPQVPVHRPLVRGPEIQSTDYADIVVVTRPMKPFNMTSYSVAPQNPLPQPIIRRLGNEDGDYMDVVIRSEAPVRKNMTAYAPPPPPPTWRPVIRGLETPDTEYTDIVVTPKSYGSNLTSYSAAPQVPIGGSYRYLASQSNATRYNGTTFGEPERPTAQQPRPLKVEDDDYTDNVLRSSKVWNNTYFAESAPPYFQQGFRSNLTSYSAVPPGAIGGVYQSSNRTLRHNATFTIPQQGPLIRPLKAGDHDYTDLPLVRPLKAIDHDYTDHPQVDIKIRNRTYVPETVRGAPLQYPANQTFANQYKNYSAAAAALLPLPLTTRISFFEPEEHTMPTPTRYPSGRGLGGLPDQDHDYPENAQHVVRSNRSSPVQRPDAYDDRHSVVQTGMEQQVRLFGANYSLGMLSRPGEKELPQPPAQPLAYGLHNEFYSQNDNWRPPTQDQMQLQQQQSQYGQYPPFGQSQMQPPLVNMDQYPIQMPPNGFPLAPVASYSQPDQQPNAPSMPDQLYGPQPLPSPPPYQGLPMVSLSPMPVAVQQMPPPQFPAFQPQPAPPQPDLLPEYSYNQNPNREKMFTMHQTTRIMRRKPGDVGYGVKPPVKEFIQHSRFYQNLPNNQPISASLHAPPRHGQGIAADYYKPGKSLLTRDQMGYHEQKTIPSYQTLPNEQTKPLSYVPIDRSGISYQRRPQRPLNQMLPVSPPYYFLPDTHPRTTPEHLFPFNDYGRTNTPLEYYPSLVPYTSTHKPYGSQNKTGSGVNYNDESVQEFDQVDVKAVVTIKNDSHSSWDTTIGFLNSFLINMSSSAAAMSSICNPPLSIEPQSILKEIDCDKEDIGDIILEVMVRAGSGSFHFEIVNTTDSEDGAKFMIDHSNGNMYAHARFTRAPTGSGLELAPDKTYDVRVRVTDDVCATSDEAYVSITFPCMPPSVETSNVNGTQRF